MLLDSQVSQETGKMVWYLHLIAFDSLSLSTQSNDLFSIVDETEIDVFLKFPCFLYHPANVGNLSVVLLPFLNPVWTFESSSFT